ncbi:MAG: hypothetical protein V4449_01605 [Patescibacteria group bacterium]
MKNLLIATVLLGAVLSAFFVFNQRRPLLSGAGEMRQYVRDDISFSYPAYYFVEEKDEENTTRSHHSITLTEDTEENKAMREGLAPGREGPTAIVIDIFQNDLDHMTAKDWIVKMPRSNYALSPDSILTARTVGAIKGFEYRWSGLYEARAVVVVNDYFVYSLTATYLTPEDLILKDFETILESVKFE